MSNQGADPRATSAKPQEPPNDWDEEMKNKLQAEHQVLCDQLQSRCYRRELPCICGDKKSKYKNSSEIDTELRIVLGTILFGEPKEKAKKENHFTCFGTKQMKQINKVLDSLTKNKNEADNGIKVAIIVISVIGEDKKWIQVPIFRVSNEEETWCKFVDPEARTYKNFDDFLASNKFPPAELYCPYNGKYDFDVNKQVILHYDKTPAAKRNRCLLPIVQIGTAILSGIFAIVYPLSVPAKFFLGGTACFAGYIVVEDMVDKIKHESGVTCLQVIGFIGCLVVLASVTPSISTQLQSALGLKSLKSVIQISCVFMNAPLLGQAALKIKKLTSSGKLQEMIRYMLRSLSKEKNCSVEMLVSLASKYVPYIISRINTVLEQEVQSANELKSNLTCEIEKNKQYGPGLSFLWEIAAFYYNLDKEIVEVARKGFKLILNFLQVLFAAERQTDKVMPEAELMTRILNNAEIITQLLATFDTEEKNYHFPCDHSNEDALKQSGKDETGQISPETYEFILKKFWEQRVKQDASKLSFQVAQDPGHYFVTNVGHVQITVFAELKMVKIKIWVKELNCQPSMSDFF